LKWGINSILEIEKWNSNITVLSHIPMFKEHKKNYSMICLDPDSYRDAIGHIHERWQPE